MFILRKIENKIFLLFFNLSYNYNKKKFENYFNDIEDWWIWGPAKNQDETSVYFSSMFHPCFMDESYN